MPTRESARLPRVAPGRAVALMAAALLLPLLAVAPASRAAAHHPRPPILAADFPGQGWEGNVWDSDLHGANATFLQMRRNGFNTVGLVVPWGEFEPTLTPSPRFNSAAFAALRRLIAMAERDHLDVVLRLGFLWDNDPSDQLPNGQRVEALFTDPAVYAAWLAYVSEVRAETASFTNIRLAYLSWEDFWLLPAMAAAAVAEGPQHALELAQSSGYQGWLSRTTTLRAVERTYDASFGTWADVPVPSPEQPAFRLLYAYQDQLLADKIFEPSRRRFPGLTFEARVDADPIYDGTARAGQFVHATLDHLPGTTLTDIYYAPYLGLARPHAHVSATAALAGLAATLAAQRRLADGRRLFISEFEFVTNAPQVSGTAALYPGQVAPFLRGSAPILARSSVGYGVWTYRDLPLSMIYNSSFALGVAGWTVTAGTPTVGRRASGVSYLRLPPAATITQDVPASRDGTPQTRYVTVSLTARGPSTLRIGLGPDSAAIRVVAGWHSYRHTFRTPAEGLPDDDVSLTAGAGTVDVTDVQSYGFVQIGDLYSVTGVAERDLAAVRELNAELAG